MKTEIDEPVCESCGASAGEDWETESSRSTVLILSLVQPIHQKGGGWRTLCNECEEGLRDISQ